jgi:phosphate transport system substrate-binding protein
MLLGAGATFASPIYQRWFSEFHRLHPKVSITYQSVGSGAGIRELVSGIVDFAATDGPMTDEQLEQARVPIVHLPTVLNAIVVIYNIPGVTAEVKFTPQTLARIFLGRITSWNDPAIASINPGLSLPNQLITPVHRSDAGGPTFIFSDYLSKVSPDWQASVGKGTAVNWPLGLASKGNEGVAGTVHGVEGSIGYVELTYALNNKLTLGSVQNFSGIYVKPSLEGATAAAASIKDMPADFRVSITDAPGRDAYPIVSFTWLLIPKTNREQARNKDMVAFLDWIYRGESMTPVLGYAPLPVNVVRQVKQKIRDLR